MGAPRREPGLFVATPDNDVCGSLDVPDLVAVYDFLVAGKIKHLRSLGAESLSDGEQHGIAKAAADEDHRLIGCDMGWCSGRAHQYDWFAWL